MGWLLKRLRGREGTPSPRDQMQIRIGDALSRAPAPAPAIGRNQTSPNERRYVPTDDPNRFHPNTEGIPPLHLVSYQGGLRLCENETGLLIGPTDRRLFALGIYSYNCVGEQHHAAACRAGDFSPGAPLRLVREPDNPHDPNAIADLSTNPDTPPAGYISKGHAQRLSRILDAGIELDAIATYGTPPGHPCDRIAIIAARPQVLTRLLTQPRTQ